MLRTIISLLMCVTFLILGALGEQLLNLLEFAFRKQEYLPGLTLIIKKCFPLNSGFFLDSTFPFCAATVGILLGSFQNPPWIKRERFLDYCFIVCLTFVIYFAIFLIGLVIPFHILEIVMGPPHAMNTAFTIITGILLIIAIALFSRILWRKGKTKSKLAVAR